MNPVDVSIIWVNYHTSDLLKKSIDSVVRHTRLSYQLIVVDNNSEPGLGEELQARYGSALQFVALDQNLGFGGANNEGLRLAVGRYAWFLNPDTCLLNPAADLLAAYLDAHPEAGAVGGNLFDVDRRPAHSYMRLFPSLRLELVARGGNRLERLALGRSAQFNYTGQAMPVAYVTGADLMVRRSLLEQVGAFDTQFFMYYEETDLCKRLSDAGHAVVSVPQAEVCHYEGASFKTNRRREEMKAESRRYYYRKHLSAVERFFAIFAAKTNAALRCVAFRLLRRKDKYEHWKLILHYA